MEQLALTLKASTDNDSVICGADIISWQQGVGWKVVLDEVGLAGWHTGWLCKTSDDRWLARDLFSNQWSCHCDLVALVKRGIWHTIPGEWVLHHLQIASRHATRQCIGVVQPHCDVTMLYAFSNSQRVPQSPYVLVAAVDKFSDLLSMSRAKSSVTPSNLNKRLDY